MIATTYRRRVLGMMLKAGNARIVGKMAEPGPWPNGDHYWIINDLHSWTIYHVKVTDRPSWKRYAPKW